MPCDVEVHESQFSESMNETYHSPHQTAIKFFFSNNFNITTPDDCPLRHSRIVVCDEDESSPVAAGRSGDFGTQTELMLPSSLPKELDAILKPFSKPELADEVAESQERRGPPVRRKLFKSNDLTSDFQDTPPSTSRSRVHSNLLNENLQLRSETNSLSFLISTPRAESGHFTNDLSMILPSTSIVQRLNFRSSDGSNCVRSPLNKVLLGSPEESAGDYAAAVIGGEIDDCNFPKTISSQDLYEKEEEMETEDVISNSSEEVTTQHLDAFGKDLSSTSDPEPSNH